MTKVNKQGRLQDQVALVTGASRGIGAAIAERLAMEGARIVASARTSEPGTHPLPGSLEETVANITNAGGEAVAIQANLARESDRVELVQQAMEAFGRVDILVNNAAVTYFTPVVDFSRKHFDLMLEVQVWAPFHLAQLVLPRMISRKSGWILNISSHAAIHPKPIEPGINGTVYGMCKAALERFTTGLAQEVHSENIGVNVISPGLIATAGAVHHRLVDEAKRHRLTPMSYMAEACLRLVHGNPRELTGRITYASDIVREFSLEPAELISTHDFV